MTRHPLPRRPAAFTLVEVLAALTLTAIILPVAMRGVSLALASASEARHQMEAAALAEAKLADLRITGDWQTGDLSGDFSPDHPEYRWAATVGAWEDAALQQLEVRVTWTSRGRERGVTVTTLLYTGSN